MRESVALSEAPTLKNKKMTWGVLTGAVPKVKIQRPFTGALRGEMAKDPPQVLPNFSSSFFISKPYNLTWFLTQTHIINYTLILLKIQLEITPCNKNTDKKTANISTIQELKGTSTNP